MATYEFKSLDELAASFDTRASALREQADAYKGADKTRMSNRADAFQSCADIIRDSVIDSDKVSNVVKNTY